MRAPARVEPDLPPAPAEEHRYRGVLALDPAARAGRAALLAALSDPSWRVRAAAVERLAEAGGPVARDLVEALSPGGGAGRRGAAAEALARLGAAAVEPLLEALWARSPEVRSAAAEVLGEIGDRRAREPLAARLRDPDPGARVAAAEALGKLADPGAAAALLGALEADDPPLQRTALDALSRLGVPPPLARLEALAADPGLRRSALRLLGLCDGPRAEGLLAEALADRSRAAREAALAALWQRRSRTPGELGGLGEAVRSVGRRVPDLGARCAGALSLGDLAVAGGALCALGWLAEPGLAPAVAAAAEDERLYAAAVEALQALGDRLRGAVAPILAGLAPRPRAAALSALARVGDPGALPQLEASARSDDPPVRTAAAEALGHLRLGRRGAPFDPGAGPRMTAAEFGFLGQLVKEHCGLSFREDMKYLLERRLAPRLEARGLAGFGDYHRLLRRGAARGEELDTAVELLTTNETYFYREPNQLRAFAEEILPLLALERARQRRLRVWSAGCSTGEEPYTIAILLLRAGLFAGWDLEVLGTDLSRRVLAAARAGVYGASAFRSPEAEQLRPWFRAQDGRQAIREEVARMVRFAHLNLVDAAAVEALPAADVVFCRNVLIYFDLPARRRVLASIRRRLRPGGYLLLGHSESLVRITADFELVHLRHDLVYRRPAEEPVP